LIDLDCLWISLQTFVGPINSKHHIKTRQAIICRSRRSDQRPRPKEDAMFDAPMTAQAKRSAFAPLWNALGWPARVAEARRTRALLAELSEREWRDILPGRDAAAVDADQTLEDDPAERAARARAIRAWYGHGARAA
jgi:hypothetical protein